MQLGQLFVGKAPAKSCVVYFGLSSEGPIGLGHSKWSPGHGFHSARYINVTEAAADIVDGIINGHQSRAAQTVDRATTDGERQLSQEYGHARYVAIILTGLIGAA